MDNNESNTVLPRKHIPLEERLKDFHEEYSFEEFDWGNPNNTNDT